MIRLTHRLLIQAPIERCFDLARSVDVHVLRNYHCNAPASAVAGLSSGLAGLGVQTTWKARHFFVWHRLATEVTAFRAPVYFRETMRHGTFKAMQHNHYFRTVESGMVEMESQFSFAAPMSILGFIVEHLVLRRYMQALLAERSLVIKQVAESDEWKRYLPAEAQPSILRELPAVPSPDL